MKLFNAFAVGYVIWLWMVCGSAEKHRDMNIFEIQLEDFKEKVNNIKGPVIIDFTATWCKYCKILTDRIESVIGKNSGNITLLKVDINEHSDLALDYEVTSVPVLLAMHNGTVEQRLVGLQETDELRQWVDNVVA